MDHEMTGLLKRMRQHPGNERIKRVVAILARNVSDLEERVKALEQLVPPPRVGDPSNPHGLEWDEL